MMKHFKREADKSSRLRAMGTDDFATRREVDWIHIDVLVKILDFVGRDFRTLKATSLVRRQWREPSQRRMFHTVTVDIEQGRRRGRRDMLDEYVHFFDQNEGIINYVSTLIIRGACADASLEFDSDRRLLVLLSQLRVLEHLTFRDVALTKSSDAPELTVRKQHIKTVCLERVTDQTGEGSQYFFHSVKFGGTLSVKDCKIPKYLAVNGQAALLVNVAHIRVEDYFERFPDFQYPTNYKFPRLNALSFDVTGVTPANANRYNQSGGNRAYYGGDVHRNLTHFIMKHGERLTSLRLDVSQVDLMHDFGKSLCLRLIVYGC